MCDRRESILAVGRAADELLEACISHRTFRDTLADTIDAPVPGDMLQLLVNLEPDEPPVEPIRIQQVHPVVISFAEAKGKRRGRR